MGIGTALYEGELVCFTSIDMEKDPAEIARWMKDSDFLRLSSFDAALPLPAARIKKKLEKIEKEQDEKQNTFHFSIRTLSDEHLVGYAQIVWVEWTHAAAMIDLVIGDPQNLPSSLAADALRLLLKYAFDELNLYRLHARIAEYNQEGLKVFQGAGFVQEVCRRKAIYRDGRTWDVYIFGQLRAEWEANRIQGD